MTDRTVSEIRTDLLAYMSEPRAEADLIVRTGLPRDLATRLLAQMAAAKLIRIAEHTDAHGWERIPEADA